MDDIWTLFIELVQVAIGRRTTMSRNPSEGEWFQLFEMAQMQAVAGIVFNALDGLSKKGQKVPSDLLYEWIGLSEQIRFQNQIVNQRCCEITKVFAEAGFRSCILKGQGNALMYPEPLNRTSGDIDIWIDGKREDIKRFVKERYPDARDVDMHIDFPIYDDVEVEAHYKPSFDFRPKFEKRLQQWFLDCAEEQFTHQVQLAEGAFLTPTLSFNAIHQLSHIMNHFFVEGIGIKQFVDYYYVLKHLNVDCKINEVRDSVKWLGLEMFARGVMWVEKEVLGLESERLIVEPDEKIGRLILKEVMAGGNFGQYDERYKVRNKGLLARGLADTCRLIRLMPYFPSLSIWKILNKVTNQRWKL